MSGAAIVFLILYTIGMMEAILKHGQPKETTHNAWLQLAATLIGILILHWGGFFS